MPDLYHASCVPASFGESFSQIARSVLGGSPLDDSRYTVFPGFCDVHVHFREPGFSYKETIASGCRAAAHGGYTAVCTMPNLNPVPDCPASLKVQQEIIRADACVNVYPYGAISVGERGEKLAELALLAPDVVAFSDDGHGVQSEELMLEAMRRCKELGKVLAAHCEDNSLLRGGYIHDGAYAAANGHRGICSESEYGQIARDLELAAKTGCAYHICHVSTHQSVELVRQAKKSGVDVTCETAPHYLLLDETDLREDGRFKMNPPLRAPEDREALVQGLLDGTVDMVATDHAPHSAAEKSKGLAGSAFGIVGLETAFPVLYTGLVRTGAVPLETLIERMTYAPRRRFGLPLGQDITVWALESADRVDPDRFASMGRATPFDGWEVYARCRATICGGKTVYEDTQA